MEKELEYYDNLEIQIDKITYLVAKLKEDNEQLREQNEQLLFQIRSANGNKSHSAAKTSINPPNESSSLELNESQIEMVCQRVKNALLKLNQLRQRVMETD